MPNLQKCSQGHFYDADLFSTCPYCPSGSGKTDKTDTSPEDPGKTIPVNNESQTNYTGPGKTVPVRESHPSGPATVGQKLDGMAARMGGWLRLLCMAAALVMLIYAVGTLYEGYDHISMEDDYNIYGSEFVELKHKTGQYELISSVAAAALLVCAVLTVKTKGQNPPIAASALAMAAVEVTAFLHLNTFNDYWGHGPYTEEMIFYLLPPLLSFLAVYLYWNAQKKQA